MPPKKSSSKSAKKKKTSTKSTAKSTTDIKAKKKSAAKAKSKRQARSEPKPKVENTFTIKQLDYGAPEIEPLLEDVEALEHEIAEMQDEPTENLDISYEPSRKPAMKVASVADLDEVDSLDDDVPKTTSGSTLEDIAPRDLIKVRFGTFVNLVAYHDMDEVVAENAEKELIMEANLLTELASSRDQREERKIPLVFLVGIALGVVLTYIFFST